MIASANERRLEQPPLQPLNDKTNPPALALGSSLSRQVIGATSAEFSKSD